ncbi:MAG: HD domain-containing protein [Rhizomicrobium sp.]
MVLETKTSDAEGGSSSTRFASALAYATLIHAGQRRKGTSIPYISHLMSVSALVMEFGGDEDLAIAGLLHDALEDCGAWHEPVIRQNWGDRVADIVRACTDGVPDATGKKPPWEERKRAYLAHLQTADADTLLVSACDKLHNARAIAADLPAGHDVFSRFKAGRGGTLWYYDELLCIFRARLGGDSLLARALAEAVDRMRRDRGG